MKPIITSAKLEARLKADAEAKHLAVIGLTALEIRGILDGLEAGRTLSDEFQLLEGREKIPELSYFLTTRFELLELEASRPTHEIKAEWEAGDISGQAALEELANRYEGLLTQEKQLDALKGQVRATMSEVVESLGKERVMTQAFELSITHPYSYPKFDTARLKEYVVQLEREGLKQIAAQIKDCQQLVNVAGSLKVERKKGGGTRL